jgi:hypothetical protein
MKITSIPKNAKKLKEFPHGAIILAFGEQTGHMHQISLDEAAEYDTDIERFIRVLEKAYLKHEEHSTIVLPKGNYKVIQQVEFTPEAIRNVTD